MKKKNVIVVIGLIANVVLGIDGIEFLEKRFENFSVMQSSLILTFSPSMGRLIIIRENERRLSEHNEVLILTSEMETVLTDGHHGTTVFTPVFFRNQQEGFKIAHIIDQRSLGRIVTTNVAYAALSNILIRMKEDDVEMIMENGEWKTHGNPPSITQAKTPDNITEDEQGEEKSKANIFWLCVVIFHCLLAILWLIRKKRKRETKN